MIFSINRLFEKKMTQPTEPISKSMNFEPWLKWAIFEGLTKMISRIIQKVIGTVSNTWGGTFLAAGIVGLVQVIAGGLIYKKKGGKLLGDPVGALGSMLYGVFALTATVFGFATFLYGGDVSTSTFIITLSIIPGMIIDIIFFKYKSTLREWAGILVAVMAGWAVLDFPKMDMLLSLPMWVWFSFATMMSVAINQGITQKVREVDPMFKNFWGGLVALIGTLVVIISTSKSDLLWSFTVNSKLWLSSLVVGIIVIAMWSFNLMSYKIGASIALKKLVVNTTYFLGTMVLGTILYGEQITGGKLTALPLFLIAFVLMDKKAWDYVTGRSTDGSPGNAAKPA